jgi:hypothetical protein
MHPEILNENQLKLLPLLKKFKREFYLVGGTAVALQIGHRMSIDFDMFKLKPFVSKKILNKINENGFHVDVGRRVDYQLNVTVCDVKMTFFQYLYEIETPVLFKDILRMPDLITLGAMKAFALGRRSKWKDYVDLYFLLRDFFSIEQISQKADVLYGQEFSAKLFRSQLSFHKDLDYSEPVVFLPGWQVPDDVIKSFLIDRALEW